MSSRAKAMQESLGKHVLSSYNQSYASELKLDGLTPNANHGYLGI